MVIRLHAYVTLTVTLYVSRQASAIVKGLIDSGFNPNNLYVADIALENLDALNQYGVHTTRSNREVPENILFFFPCLLTHSFLH